MSSRTIHTCDRCGDEHEGRSNLFQVRIEVNACSGFRATPDHDVHFDALPKVMEWCGKCCNEYGIARPKDKDADPVEQVFDSQPTIEDFLRQIAREEAEQVQAEARR